MKVHSYSIIHYGRDYLSYALRSAYDRLDALRVVYTGHPSHGHQTDAPPPERKEELMAQALKHDPDRKVFWHEVSKFFYEGQHRDFALSLCQGGGADLCLVLDCDEVWPADTLAKALAHVWRENKARNWLVNFTHLWRSFNWCCHDNGWPVRIVDFRHREGTAYVPQEFGEIYHFGYAVRPDLMAYKWQIHGHKPELRPEWWKEKWLAWPPPEDCHPTNGKNWWKPEPFDRTKLPEFMREHPFYGLERID